MPDCQVCNDTGEAWTPDPDGGGAWGMACPDCDMPYPLAAPSATQEPPF